MNTIKNNELNSSNEITEKDFYKKRIGQLADLASADALRLVYVYIKALTE